MAWIRGHDTSAHRYRKPSLVIDFIMREIHHELNIHPPSFVAHRIAPNLSKFPWKSKFHCSFHPNFNRFFCCTSHPSTGVISSRSLVPRPIPSHPGLLPHFSHQFPNSPAPQHQFPIPHSHSHPKSEKKNFIP